MENLLHKKIAIAIAAVFLVASARASVGEILVDNGTPNGLSGNEMTQWVQSEDFVLDQPARVGGVRFWAVEIRPDSYQGAISWWLHSNAGGEPGDILHFGSAVPIRVPSGNSAPEGTEYQFDFALPNLLLSPNSYWLTLHNGDPSFRSRSEFYWSTSDGGPHPGEPGMEELAGFRQGFWVTTAQEHAFQLFSAPIPEASASAALLAAGLLSWTGTRWFLRRRPAS